MFKTIRGGAPDYLQTSFSFSSDVHTTLLRSSSTYQLYVPKHNLYFAKPSFFSGSSIWNSLTYEIQNPTSIQQFKFMFDGHILHFLFSQINVYAAIPGVSAEYTLLLSKCIQFVIIVSRLRNIR